MIVFKLYLKLLNTNKILIFIYLGIFIGITMLFMNNYAKNPTNFSNRKTNVALIDNDNTKFTNDLREYLTNYAVFKEIPENKLDDAFFYREIEVIVEIPDGFTTAFYTDNPLKIKTRVVPGSSTSFTFQHEMEKFLDYASVYIDNDLTTDDIGDTIKRILENEAETSFPEVQRDDYSYVQAYYNFIAYVVLALIITVIGMIMLSFKPIEIKRRNNVGSIANKKMNLILILSNLLLSLFLLLALIVLSIILYTDIMFKTKGILIMLNSVIFTLSVITLSYLIVMLFDSKNMIAALGTVISLGFSFITGVFIPQELIDDKIIALAKFLPSYWYVYNNDYIVTGYNAEGIGTIINNYFIQIGFSVLFIVTSIIISKKKQRAEC